MVPPYGIVLNGWPSSAHGLKHTYRYFVQFGDTVDSPEVNVVSSVQIGGGSMQAYCMKCRAKREMKDAKSITMKNGRPATQGVCPTCGTKMFRIGKS